ncbi:PREDICTED: uncharacterized protein LOC108377236 [Rhagoletis zephyria]|uniref:uncharacterized protein LOC108377236 n=1 Tax=Rhagoletis zephyria TaxID=28612 RepID=UPI0008116DF3|nr:PREDICTED: uncharacterized protein LOC108377236 [Rhagoletis zephyria]
MQSLKIFIWLLVAYSITLINARAIDDDLAARLDELASNSENDERFNEISDFEDINEVYFPKRRQKSQKIITRNWDVSTKRPADVEELTTEIEKGFVHPMVSTMFSFMRDVMRQVFH